VATLHASFHTINMPKARVKSAPQFEHNEVAAKGGALPHVPGSSDVATPRVAKDYGAASALEWHSREIMESSTNNALYDPTLIGVHNRLFLRIFQLGNILERQSAKELGITNVQWAVLGALAGPRAVNGMSFGEMAEYLVVSRQSLDGVLKRLERDEHVARVADSTDRRARQVILTPKGKKFWDDLQPRIHEFYRQAVTNLRFDDKVAFVHYMNTLKKGLAQVELPDPTKEGEQ
jgi:DNA-binding MarR family transcriptional regulator